MFPLMLPYVHYAWHQNISRDNQDGKSTPQTYLQNRQSLSLVNYKLFFKFKTSLLNLQEQYLLRPMIKNIREQLSFS